MIYNSLLEGLDFFYNPQSVKILECSAIYLADTQNPYFIDSETGHCYIKVTAMTKGGGSSNKVYCLVTGDNNTKFPRGSMWTWDDVIDGLESMGLGNEMIRSLGFGKNLDYYIDSSDGINVGGLNKALKEHWEELGLD